VASDSAAKIHFDDTEVGYRDDNRLMWVFIEEGDEEVFEERQRPPQEMEEEFKVPPRLYNEWDYSAEHYRPDWVSVYEHLQPQKSPELIDRLLTKHKALAQRLKKIIDMLKRRTRCASAIRKKGQA
jgi:nitric oxide reductase activation protein